MTRKITLTEGGPRTWWDLANEHLGDGTAWRQLWTLNAGGVQPDGATLTSERVVLRPGWTIVLPASENTTSATSPADEGTDVVVQPGDTLSQLAVDHDMSDWTQLWQANAGRDQPDGGRLTDPDRIEPGWIITLPGPTGPIETAGGPKVTVMPGDTLSEIAAEHDTDVATIMAANAGLAQPDGGVLTDPDRIEVNWQLQLPGVPADTAPPATTPPASAADNPAAPADTPADIPLGGPDLPSDTTDGSEPEASDVIAPAPADSAPLTPRPPVTGTEPTVGPETATQAESSRTGIVTAFAGAGGVLAALALTALVRYRRRQFRHRRPGHALPPIPDDLATMERALLVAGSTASPDARWLDEALHGLAHLADADGAAVPDAVAAGLSGSTLVLVLQTPQTEPPGAWVSSTDGTRWTLDRNEPTGYRPELRGYLAPPFPTLVTIGATPAGEHWLVDLESIGAMAVVGDRARAVALTRFMAAELAHNSWSETVEVTLAGFGQEMATMHPDRLTFVADPVAAVARLRQHSSTMTEMIRQSGANVLESRNGLAGDAWAPEVLLLATADGDPVPGGTAEFMEGLTAGRSSVALVMVGGQAGAHDPGDDASGGWELRIDDDGVLTVPALGVSLIAQQLQQSEAGQLAQLLAFAADPTPVADRSGTKDIDEQDIPSTDPATEPQPVDRPGSVLDGPDETYLSVSATTEDDLQTLAPAVPAHVRARIEAADDSLDADLAAWHDPVDPRPRVVVLGGPRVTAGTARFSAFTTEIAVYLSTAGRGGVSIDRYATDLWPSEPDIVAQTTVKSKVRTSLSQVRKLLGINPATGTDYLPRNGGAPGGQYQLDSDVLLDADLFRRLRIRGLARGTDGLGDLHAALELVRGAPFAMRRPGGYGWLADHPLDHEYTAMVVDLAHVVATYHLSTGNAEQAAAAAQTALRAGSSEDTPLLDLVAACHLQGQAAQAEAYVRQIMVNHDADLEEDLPPRTYEVLRRRRWLPPAA